MFVLAGDTDITTYFKLRLSATSLEATGLTPTDFDLQFVRSGAVPSAKVDATALASVGAAHSDNTVIEVDGTDQPGLYRIDWPDSAFAAGVREVILTAKTATAFTEELRVELSAPIGPVLLQGVTHTGAVIPTVTTLTGHTAQTADHTAAIAAIPTTAMRGTDSAALATVATEARLAELDAGNLPAAVDSRMAEASINTTAGAVDNVTLVATTTTNTDMRGTDSVDTATMRGTDGANTVVPPTVAELNARTLASGSYALEATHTSMKGATFTEGTDSLEALRDRGDAAWVTGAGGSNPFVLQNTTIATLASQTSFTLTAGSADNGAYDNMLIVIEDAATATQKAVGLIRTYVGGTLTITLREDPGVFVMAVGDTVDVLAVSALLNELIQDDGQGETQFTAKALENISSVGGGFISGTYRWSNDVTATDPTSGRVKANNATLASITEVYIHSITQSGSNASAIIEALRSGDGLLIAVEGSGDNFFNFAIDATPTDNGAWYTISGTVGDSGGTISNNNTMTVTFAFAAEDAATIASAVWDKSRAAHTIVGSFGEGWDLLLARITATLFTGITSLAEWLGLVAGKQAGDTTARTEIRATGAGSGGYDETSDSQEALRDRGDAAWVTGAGGSVPDGLHVTPLIPLDIDLADTATYRVGLMLTNMYDDLPTTVEITPGTLSIDRKIIGGTSWSAILTDVACLEIDGLIYFDEVYDGPSGYAEGDSLRWTFKNQKITVAANDHELIGVTGRIFYGHIRQRMRGTEDAALATVATEARLAELDAGNLPAAVDSRMAEASINTTLGQIDTVSTVSSVDFVVNTLDMRGTEDAAKASLFTGITSIAQWLGLLAGKQVGDATARTEIRATGAGSGGYDEASDSQEAINDSALTVAQINAEVLDVMNIDTYPEPGQLAPPENASIFVKLNHIYKRWRNQSDNDGITTQYYANNDTTVDQKQATSAPGGTATVGKIVSGP